MMLYAADRQSRPADVLVAGFYGSFADGQPLDPPPSYAPPGKKSLSIDGSADARAYAERLVRGVLEDREALDALIQGISRNWRLDRMGAVDRNLLRLGAYELQTLKEEVPRNVVINEAVELAKRFGSRESGGFVNGILDRIGRQE